MPNTLPPAIREPHKPRLLCETIVLLCVAVVAACAGVAAHFPQWHNACLVIGCIVMIPMCWAGESSLDTNATPSARS